MVAINWRWQAEKFLQDDVDMSCLGQILPSNNMCNALASIIQHTGQMIARRKLFPRQHDITQLRRVSFDPAAIGFKA